MSAPLIYEINTRCWLRELSIAAGHSVGLGEIPEAQFKTWQRLGFTHIWLMGVWRTGPRVREIALGDPGMQSDAAGLFPGFQPDDIGGSPYAIAGYAVAAELGGDSGLREFRRRLNAAGLKLILDFVPNHVGLDHPWVGERPWLFVSCEFPAEGAFRQTTPQGTRWLAHGRDPFFPPWIDTVQLDYRNSATREIMVEELLRVSEMCDGVRCDMAMLLLSDVFRETWRRYPMAGRAADGEFWTAAVAAVRARRSDFLLIAEVYWELQERLQSLGFDFTYYKELYDAVVNRRFEWLQRRLHQVEVGFLRRCVHFLENHDEPRAAALFPVERHQAAAVLLLALPGMRLLHEGQLTGARRRIPVQWVRRPGEDRDDGIARFYERLLGILPQTSIGRGAFQWIKPVLGPADFALADGLVAIVWHARDRSFDVVLINLNAASIHGFLPLAIDEGGNRTWRGTDCFDGSWTEWSAAELGRSGLTFQLSGESARIWHFSAG